jgi:hypothetical protein
METNQQTNQQSNTQRNVLIIIIILLLLGGGIALSRIGGLKTDLAISNQNNAALGDSLKVTRNKAGELEYSKGILVSEKKDLKDYSESLNKELKKIKGKVSELNIIIASVSTIDTLLIPNEVVVYADSSYGLKWFSKQVFDENNSRYLEGVSKFHLVKDSIIPLETEVTKDEFNFNLITGLKEGEDGVVSIFAKSDYPGFAIGKIEGAIIDPKKHPVLKKFTKQKKWGVGPYIGFGWSNSINPSIQVGIGVQYSIFRF